MKTTVIEVLGYDNWYDGPIEGACLVDGAERHYELSSDPFDEPRRYRIVDTDVEFNENDVEWPPPFPAGVGEGGDRE